MRTRTSRDGWTRQVPSISRVQDPPRALGERALERDARHRQRLAQLGRLELAALRRGEERREAREAAGELALERGQRARVAALARYAPAAVEQRAGDLGAFGVAELRPARDPV